MGAGALNYGHNHPLLKSAISSYLARDGIIQSLDLHTVAKRDFIRSFVDNILEPRGLHYKMAFPGPTGTNAVELSLKFARCATGRSNVIAFTGGFHGMSLGSLSATANRFKRAGAGMPLPGVTRLPYDGYFGEGVDTAQLAEKMLSDPGGGIDPPAAILIETIQGEGGLAVASPEWLRRISRLARQIGALLIVDDIQAGCGRSGQFFSFENTGITPDIVCLSKSLGGLGLPIALVLIRPDLDILGAGQHNGTFRGSCLAFVAGAAAFAFWRRPEFVETVAATCGILEQRLSEMVRRFPGCSAEMRGRGAMVGLQWSEPAVATTVSQEAFRAGLIVETSGADGRVLKLLPALNIPAAELHQGLDVLESVIARVTAT
jgi:diaminobutyrate-2-oxoglutarate transaminase